MRQYLALLPTFAALAAACGSGDERTPFSSSSAVSDAGPAGDAQPIDPDARTFCTGSECSKLKLAFTRVLTGDTDRGTNPYPYAWEYYGADYDGLRSNYVLNGECQPADGEPAYAPTDGLNGIDNEFGRRILPLLSKWDPSPSQASDDALRAGARTPMIVFGQLGGSMTGGAKLRAFFTYFANGRMEPILGTWEDATFENGMFDSGPMTTPVTIELTLGAQPMRVSVQRLRAQFELTPDNRAIGGQLSGGVRVIDMQAAVAEHVGRTAPVECGVGLENLKQAIARAPDVLADGRSDRTARCDAISFGVGFEADPATVTGTKDSPPAPAPPCP